MDARTFKCISLNGVKQGGCLSPMLFTLYLDGLIQKLKHSGRDCHIGRTYCGVFGYADDLAIVSLTLFGISQIIEICKNMHQKWTYYSTQNSLNYYVIICY